MTNYYAALCLMDRIGRRAMQMQGFAFMAALYAALALWFDSLSHAPGLLLLLYGLTFFFSNFGPNSTTFILPAETYPPHVRHHRASARPHLRADDCLRHDTTQHAFPIWQVRTTLNGFSAACGKLGAVVGSAAFSP